jgi:hypothetical protein
MITVNPKLAASILPAVSVNAEPMLSIGSAEGLSFLRARAPGFAFATWIAKAPHSVGQSSTARI